MKYSEAGVDIEKGDQASRIFYEASRQTWGRLLKTGFDDFTGLRYVELPELKDIVIGSNVDAVGTKAEVAERLQKFDTLGFDLMAMVCDDAVIRGAQPVAVTNTIECNHVLLEPMQQMADGLKKAALEANVGVINGEIAEVGERVKGYGTFCANWGASCVWLAQKQRLISGKAVKPDDVIVALKEDGFRSNGLSLARKIMELQYGKDWHEHDHKLAEQILHPSRLYTRFAVSLFGGLDNLPAADVHAMTHVTGGGIVGKLARTLKSSNLGAELTNLFEPCTAMKRLQEMGKVSDEEAYGTWNMGNGFLLVASEPETVLKQAKKFGVEAKVAGHVVKEDKIVLESKGFFKSGERLKLKSFADSLQK